MQKTKPTSKKKLAKKKNIFEKNKQNRMKRNPIVKQLKTKHFCQKF